MTEKKREELLEKMRQGILKKECEVGKWEQLEEDTIIEILELRETKNYIKDSYI